ncbi:MAG: sugar transferase [Bacteroidaceae bacterium]|nr:sugar transferase [Bacteroidaceae bacterium]MBR4966807.1 sugar transferase [Bacteroidaceae bacterium]
MGEKLMNVAIKDGMNMFERAIKRFFDIFCSFIGLVVLSPVFLIVYISLRLQNDGSVIFKQERIGYKGKSFNIYKFRTMRTDSESNGKPQLAVKGDERLTKVGKFLREHHLDELPQLFNVFIGDMSFVGPRPERQYFIDKIRKVNPNYDYLYLIRPGLTSMATLYNGYTDTFEKMLKRLEMDLEYLQKRSLWLDIKLIFTTFLYIVNGKKF